MASCRLPACFHFLLIIIIFKRVAVVIIIPTDGDVKVYQAETVPPSKDIVYNSFWFCVLDVYVIYNF